MNRIMIGLITCGAMGDACCAVVDESLDKTVAEEKQKPVSPDFKSPEISPQNNAESQLKAEMKKQKHLIRKRFRRAIEGWYAGGGAFYQYSWGRAGNMRTSYEGSAPRDIVTPEDLCIALRQNSGVAYYSVDNAAHTYYAWGNINRNFAENKNCVLGGSALLGFGKFIHGDVYGGLDCSVDWTRTKSVTQSLETTRHIYETTLKQKGFVPSLSLRIGVYSDFCDAMFFGKVGFSQLRMNVNLDRLGFFGIRRNTPMISFGMQKRINDSFSMRSEIDYRFITDSERTLSREIRDEAVLRSENEDFDPLFLGTVKMSYQTRLTSISRAVFRITGIVHLGRNRAIEMDNSTGSSADHSVTYTDEDHGLSHDEVQYDTFDNMIGKLLGNEGEKE